MGSDPGRLAGLGGPHCVNCGVELRRVFGRWFHRAQLGPVQCPRAEPEQAAAGDSPAS